MASKKDFAGMNTGRGYGAIEQAAGNRKPTRGSRAGGAAENARPQGMQGN